MKRQISILACLLMLVAIVFAVASCVKPDEQHVHDYTSSVTEAPTCTEKGEETFACKCGDTYVNELPATGHNEELEVVPAVAPTCTATGLTEGKKCPDCGQTIVPQSVVAATGHKVGASATCTDDQVCENGCGKVFAEALGHDANPTCTESDTCKRYGCNAVVEALGHDVENYICNNCDEKLVLVTTTDNYSWIDLYSFKAAVAGTYTFNVPAGLGVWNKDACDNYTSDPEIDYYANYAGDSFNVYLEAEAVFEFYIASTEKTDWEITWTWTEGDIEADEGLPEADSADLVDNVYSNDTYQVSFFTNWQGAYMMSLIVSDGVNEEWYYYFYSAESFMEGQYTITLELVPGYNDYNDLVGMSQSYFVTIGNNNMYIYNIALAGDSNNTYGSDDEGSDASADLVGKVFFDDTHEVLFIQNYRGDYMVTVIVGENYYYYLYSATVEDGYYTITLTVADEYYGDYNGWAELSADGLVAVYGNNMYVYTLVLSGESGEGDGDDEGTIDNPIIVEDLPYDIVVEGSHDVYYQYTNNSDSDITLIISYPAGNYVSGLTDYDKDEENLVYLAYVAAGETVTINPWGDNSGTYSVTVATGECTHDRLTHMDAVAPGCHYEGNIEYWVCYDCEMVWQDEALTQLTNIKNVVLPATGEGNLVHFDAVAPACHYDGNIEYWVCYTCEQVWTNEALTQLTNIKNVVLPALGGEVVHVEALEPTCTALGNIEYWYCENCEQVWQNEALTQLTNAMNVKIGALSHKYENGYCVNGTCGAVDPDYYFPMTITEALAAAKGTKVKIIGTVSSMYYAWDDNYNNCSPYIVDEDGNKIIIFRTSVNVAVGDIVTVEGVVDSYNNVNQIAQGSTLTITGHDTSYDYAEMTIAEALAATKGTNVIITGTVSSFYEVWSSFGNCSPYIVDAQGNKLLVFRTKTQVGVGDVITVKGTIDEYGGVNQIAQGSTVTVDIKHTCSSWTEATCKAPASCVVCGATTGELAEHTYVSGICSVCGASESATTTTIKCNFSVVSNGTTYYLTNTLSSGSISVTTDAASATTWYMETTDGTNYYIYYVDSNSLSQYLYMTENGTTKFAFTTSPGSYASAAWTLDNTNKQICNAEYANANNASDFRALAFYASKTNIRAYVASGSYPWVWYTEI